MKKTIYITLLLTILVSFILCSCGSKSETEVSTPVTTAEITVAPATEETSEPVIDISLPNGDSISSDAKDAKIYGITHSQCNELVETLSSLPSLEYIDLGSYESDESLSLEDIVELASSYPDIRIDYTLPVFGKTVSLSDETLDFNHIPMDDNGATIVSLMKVMQNPTYLDLDFAGINYDVMEKLREDYPECDVVWRVWIGTYYSIRTDAERFVASEEREVLNGEKLIPLKYCNKLKYLDIGHNEVEDISFMSGLENLEVAIICLNTWSDATPITNCKNLKYLEMNDTNCHDLTPLGECTALEHLNIGRLHEVTGWDSIKKLTNLKRLWITRKTYITDEELADLQKALPNTEINSTNATAVLGSWRFEADDETPVPRYAQLRLEMGYDINPDNQAYYYLDKKYYPSEGYTGSRIPVPEGYRKSE